jgi:hypothetical protein
MQHPQDVTFAQKLVHSVPFLLAFLAAFPFTLLFMIFVASYWGYFDMGIGSAVNGFVLLFAYGPIVLLLLLLLAAGIAFALRRRVSAWRILIAVLAAMALSVSALFAAEAYRTKDYPGLRQEASMGEFFRWFLQRWFSSHPKRPNQAMEPSTSRCTIQLHMNSTRRSAAERVAAHGGSSWSC